MRASFHLLDLAIAAPRESIYHACKSSLEWSHYLLYFGAFLEVLFGVFVDWFPSCGEKIVEVIWVYLEQR